MLVEKEFLLSTIFSLSDQESDICVTTSLIHMFGQTTRKLVKIALLILYQTNLRTQKSNDKHPIYRLRLPQKYEFAFSLI